MRQLPGSSSSSMPGPPRTGHLEHRSWTVALAYRIEGRSRLRTTSSMAGSRTHSHSTHRVHKPQLSLDRYSIQDICVYVPVLCVWGVCPGSCRESYVRILSVMYREPRGSRYRRHDMRTCTRALSRPSRLNRDHDGAGHWYETHCVPICGLPTIELTDVGTKRPCHHAGITLVIRRTHVGFDLGPRSKTTLHARRIRCIPGS